MGIASVLRAVGSVFSNEKNFGHPVIGHPQLNRLGLHVARIVVSDACYLLRTLPFAWLHPVLWFRFHRDGYVVVEDLLAPADYAALRQEYEAASARYWLANPLERTGERGFGRKRFRSGGFDRYDGDSANRFIDIAPRGAIRGRYCSTWKMTSLCLALFGMCNRLRKHSIYELVHGDEAINPDVQRQLHKDTFHHTFKAWYYLDDVGAEHGPTEVVPGSHRSSLRRLAWEYRRSRAAGRDPGHGSGGSFRITDAELPALGLPPPRQILCRGNSVVLVNTKAFHRRGVAPRDTVRRSLYANFRPRAFAPIVH
jgi:ectoine hydroxylase-related dioxygenase (phytanoyl-CoA dioxygenase family)